MKRVYRIKVIKTSSCFLRDIFYNTACRRFQGVITFQPVTENQCALGNMAFEDFLQFLRRRFGTVYCFGYHASFALYAGTNADVFIRDPSFLCLCTMFAGFTADRFWKLLSFIGLQNIGLIHFGNILQTGALFIQQCGKGDQEFLPHTEHKIMGQFQSFSGKVNGISGKCVIYDCFPDFARLMGIGHQSICCGDKGFPTVFTAVFLFTAFMPIADDGFPTTEGTAWLIAVQMFFIRLKDRFI